MATPRVTIYEEYQVNRSHEREILKYTIKTEPTHVFGLVSESMRRTVYAE